MSTSSAFGILNEDGTVTSTYIHYAGLYPVEDADILLNEYNTVQAARRLSEYGYLSGWDEMVSDGKDGNEDCISVSEYITKQFFVDEKFLFTNGQWTYLDDDGKFIPITVKFSQLIEGCEETVVDNFGHCNCECACNVESVEILKTLMILLKRKAFEFEPNLERALKNETLCCCEIVAIYANYIVHADV